MSMIEEVAAVLDGAAHEAHDVEQFAPGHFNLAQAYQIQRASIQRRVARGERINGIKLGFTSRAKMVQMGVDSLIWGLLTDAMVEEEGGDVDLKLYIHPRVEPEVCFVTRRAITGPLTALEAVDYLEAVAPAMEIIDHATAISASTWRTWWPTTARLPASLWAPGRAASRPGQRRRAHAVRWPRRPDRLHRRHPRAPAARRGAGLPPGP